MKISNSKKELARIISENGRWSDAAEWAAQDKYYSDQNNGVALYSAKPSRPEKGALCWGGLSASILTVIECAELLPNWHQTILSRAEYFHLYPAQDADGWIKLDGTECPSGYFNKIIDAKLKDGRVLTDLSGRFEWDTDGPSSIIAYRMHKPEKVETEFCESVMRSIPEPSYKPTIEQLMQTYTDRTHSVQLANEHLATCTKQASEVMEALSVACKAAGFDISPITAKQEPELAITDWRDLQVGDEVEYLDGGVKHRIGMIGTIDKFDSNSCTDRFFRMRDGYNLGWPTKWRFIRRP